jgi:site-specific DNA-methyltransferase (cytosine-N4-specific)
MILRGDARCLPLADGSVNTIVTSPPYHGLRTYGDDEREIGRSDVGGYLASMAACAREWLRVMADDGVVWLNLGDTASGSGGAGGDYNRHGSKEGKPRWKQGKSDRKPMQWLNIPHRTLEVFVDCGWLYRSCVTWDKNRLRPEDLRHARRPGVSSEFIFMLAKSRRHQFFPDALIERGNVWHFPPASGRNHLAPFPYELPARCIPLTTRQGQVVLDPFAGSGTTVEVAQDMGRVGIGCDLYDWSST